MGAEVGKYVWNSRQEGVIHRMRGAPCRERGKQQRGQVIKRGEEYVTTARRTKEVILPFAHVAIHVASTRGMCMERARKLRPSQGALPIVDVFIVAAVLGGVGAADKRALLNICRDS